MKRFLLRALFFLIPFLWSIYASSQPKGGKDCSTTCYSSEVVSVEKNSSTCTTYEIKVSYSGACAHELSHFSVAVPCGNISSIWNSMNWKQEIGTDPTTGVRGFKIDDISGFGKGSSQSFTVKFTVCASGEDCASQLNCWQPQVAYKASTCVNYETLNVSCKSLKASLEKDDVSCFGAGDGSLSVIIEDGQEPYTFTWSDNGSGMVRSQLAAGTYSVVVRDASGEEVVLQETISQPEKITVSGAVNAASCNGASDGSIDISVSGGAGPYKFKWNNGLETEDIGSLTSGPYTVTVTDQANCTSTASFVVTNASSITATGIQNKPDCNDTNGSIDLSVSGGTQPYSFLWSNGITDEDVTNIGAGLYSVTITDAAGCSLMKSFVIRDNNTLSLTAVSTPTSCTDDASGGLNLTVTGGTSPYTYKWSNGSTSEDPENLASGLYTVTVTDSKGCTVSGGYVVSKNTFQVSRTVVQPTCSGESNGSITLQEPVGGTAPYTYLWSTGQTGTSLTDLKPRTYSVTVTDATGCSRTITSTISNPPALSVSAAVSNTNCNAEGSFAIDINVSGGTAPYTFEWSDGNTDQDRSELTAGTYTITVTDARDCSISKEVIVEGEGPAWSCAVSEPASDPDCGSTGNMLTTSITGADSYSWTIASSDGTWEITGPANTPEISYTAGGSNTNATFTLTITKAGCVQTCSYTVSACTPDDNGGEDPQDPGGEDPGGEHPGGEDPGGETPGGEEPGGGSETCEECFSTIASLVTTSGNCHTYEMVVNTTGLCRHELSHWTLAIPCGTVSNVSNSRGWKMEYGKDPTTGLYGLKVDDIDGFGKDEASFTVRFTLCEEGTCDLSYWDPTVAYKAGLCVGIETIEIPAWSATYDTRVSVYPNPFSENVQFAWTADAKYTSLEIIDQYGGVVSRSAAQNAATHSISLESSNLPKGIYYYRLIIDGKTHSGKITKR